MTPRPPQPFTYHLSLFTAALLAPGFWLLTPSPSPAPVPPNSPLSSPGTETKNLLCHPGSPIFLRDSLPLPRLSVPGKWQNFIGRSFGFRCFPFDRPTTLTPPISPLPHPISSSL